MDTRRTPPTMADVAALAGVSHQTVSRVLNDHPSVSAKAREQVLRAITQLGYRRNLAARTLATGNSRVIGVLVSTTSLSGPSGAMLAIEENARTNGYWVSMGSLQVGSRDEVIEVAHHFIDQGVDGVIAVAQTQSAVDATLEACSQLPTVLVTSGTVPDGCFTVDIDQHGGAQQAMTILRGLGHTRIAHVSGPAGDLHAAARAAAWRESLPAAERERALVVTGDWSAQSGYQAALALQALDHPPTAVFAANDRMAYGVLRAAYEAGAHVPRDLSVVGFDDIEGSDCTIPPLTTIRQNHDALGAAALQLLLEAIRHEPVRRVKIPPEPVFRASAGAPVS